MDAYLVLITWPDGTEGLLFPRPGNVRIADSPEQGDEDFAIARNHLMDYIQRTEEAGAMSESARAKGASLRLIKFERKETLKEYTP